MYVSTSTHLKLPLSSAGSGVGGVVITMAKTRVTAKPRQNAQDRGQSRSHAGHTAQHTCLIVPMQNITTVLACIFHAGLFLHWFDPKSLNQEQLKLNEARQKLKDIVKTVTYGVQGSNPECQHFCSLPRNIYIAAYYPRVAVLRKYYNAGNLNKNIRIHFNINYRTNNLINNTRLAYTVQYILLL